MVALFFVAVIAGMSYYMLSRLERDTWRTSLLVRTAQAEFYAQGSVMWAAEQLRANLKKQKPNLVVDKMPMVSPLDDFNGYKISSKITDAQARFNLNNLSSSEAVTDFKRLMQLLDAKYNEQKATAILNAIADWIRQGQVKNEYSQYYMSLSPPYRAAHRAFLSASELQLVKGMTPELFSLLQPYITALPMATKVNVQSAPAAVLASLTPDMSLETAREIEKACAKTDIVSTAAFLNLDIVKNHRVPEGKITVLSQYFLVETTVKIEKQQIVIYTLLERTGDAKKNAVKVVWQSKGIPG